MKPEQRGFTLIEVLVAGVLLFAAVATATQVYRGALYSFSRAQAATEIQGVVPLLISEIQYQLEADKNGGEGQIGRIVYRWETEPGEQRPVARIDPSVLGEAPPSRFIQQLHHIRLELRLHNQSDWQREYRWQAYLWRPLQ